MKVNKEKIFKNNDEMEKVLKMFKKKYEKYINNNTPFDLLSQKQKIELNKMFEKLKIYSYIDSKQSEKIEHKIYNYQLWIDEERMKTNEVDISKDRYVANMLEDFKKRNGGNFLFKKQYTRLLKEVLDSNKKCEYISDNNIVEMYKILEKNIEKFKNVLTSEKQISKNLNKHGENEFKKIYERKILNAFKDAELLLKNMPKIYEYYMKTKIEERIEVRAFLDFKSPNSQVIQYDGGYMFLNLNIAQSPLPILVHELGHIVDTRVNEKKRLISNYMDENKKEVSEFKAILLERIFLEIMLIDKDEKYNLNIKDFIFMDKTNIVDVLVNNYIYILMKKTLGSEKGVVQINNILSEFMIKTDEKKKYNHIITYIFKGVTNNYGTEYLLGRIYANKIVKDLFFDNKFNMNKKRDKINIIRKLEEKYLELIKCNEISEIEEILGINLNEEEKVLKLFEEYMNDLEKLEDRLIKKENKENK